MLKTYCSLILILSVFLSFGSVSATVFSNTREADSRFITSSKQEQLTEFMQQDRSQEYERLMSVKNLQCASFLVSDLKKEFPKDDIKLHILAMRKMDLIDDVVTDILLRVETRRYRWRLPPKKESLDRVKLQSVAGSFLQRDHSQVCPENNYLTFRQQVHSVFPKFNEKEIIYTAYKEKLINKSDFRYLEALRRDKIEKWPVTLKSYYQMRKTLVSQLELNQDHSSFVTKKEGRSDQSRRERLYSRYNYYQMMMLGDLVRKMKHRLESSDISIVINYESAQSEIIPLEPMEQFRFVLKLLRKEYSTLAQSSVFENSSIDYDMVMTAAYELGYISGEELQELSDMDDIWNPKVSRKDKILRWLRSFGGVASLVVPSPFGFVPLLAIMVIESVTYTPKPTTDNDYELF